MMTRSTQWLSLTGGIVILGYGLYKLLAPPHEWILMILGLLIVAFSVSKIVKSRAEKEEPDHRSES